MTTKLTYPCHKDNKPRNIVISQDFIGEEKKHSLYLARSLCLLCQHLCTQQHSLYTLYAHFRWAGAVTCILLQNNVHSFFSYR